MIIIVVVAAAFLAGAIAGVIVLLRAGIAREESDHSLLAEPATRAGAATRRMVGLYVRFPQRCTAVAAMADGTSPRPTQRPATRRPGR
jgi:hypothetical protein